MTVSALLGDPKPQFFDNNGNPLDGGTLESYAGGTSTPLDTYTDSTGAVANNNPVTLNSRGEPPNQLYGTDSVSYKVVLKSSAGAVIWTQDVIYSVDSTLRADLADTSTDDGTKGFHLVYYPPLSGETGVTEYEYPWYDVRRYGVVVDGTTDNQTAMAAVFSQFSGTSSVVYTPPGTIKHSGTLTFSNLIMHNDSTTFECSSSTLPAITITGGSATSILTGNITVRRTTPWTSGASTAPTAHGFKITARVEAERMSSIGNQGAGFNFNASANMNKSVYSDLIAGSNGEHGCYFDGTQDDMAVWRINIRAQSNYKSGIYFEDTNPARQFYGHFYTETNALDTTSFGCYFGGLDTSQIFTYVEEPNSSKGIKINATKSLWIFDSKSNFTTNDAEASSSTFIGGQRWMRGTSANKTEDSFVNLGDNSAHYFTLTKTTSIGDLFVDRYQGDGVKERLVNQATDTDKTSALKQDNSEVILRVFHPTGVAPNFTLQGNRGTYASPLTQSVSDTVGVFKWQVNTGSGYSNAAAIHATTTTIGGGNKCTGKLLFGIAANAQSYTDQWEMDNAGKLSGLLNSSSISLKDSAGTAYTLSVDTSGRLLINGTVVGTQT